MSRIILAVAVAATLAACAKKEEEIMVVEPVTVEPEYTGKYK
jgi:nitrous oxide reductase accessory protein NosL